MEKKVAVIVLPPLYPPVVLFHVGFTSVAVVWI
jgi:hypothetical protein